MIAHDPALFPAFLKLDGRECLVVGAGKVGQSKIEGLLATGAAISVVSPRATEAVEAWAQAGKLRWRAREFEPSDLEGIFLAVVATSLPEVNERIFQEARRRRVLCNVVDDPARCDFYYPAVVRRGALQIAISTNGRSPALAQRLRKELEHEFNLDYEDWVEELGRKRQRLFERPMDPGERKHRLHKLASSESFERFSLQRRSTSPEHGLLKKSRRSWSAATPRRARQKGPVMIGSVYLVGAGPGDPELLTVKALRILQQADLVLHDDLVPPSILALASPSAEIVNVGKRCGKKSVNQASIDARMIAGARQGLTVVRLKGGDPSIFGRSGEEIEALRQAEVDFEIVPGVTAASAAAAAAGITLTHRGMASGVVFLTGHRASDRPFTEGDQTGWTGLSSSQGLAGKTVVIYMPGPDYERISAQLQAAGISGATPCVLVSATARGAQRVHKTTVQELASIPALAPPSILIVGDAAQFARDHAGSRFEFQLATFARSDIMRRDRDHASSGQPQTP